MAGLMSAFNSPFLLEKYLENGYKVVDVSESETNPSFLKASLLLPPYEAMCALIDDNMNGFNYIYWQYLSSKECDYFISAIYTAMLNGVNIALFVNNTDDMGTTIMMSLVQHISNVFGIVPEMQQNNYTFSFNQSSIIPNLDKIYFYDLIDANLYLMLYPGDGKIHTNMIPKLADELKPWITENNIEEYVNVFTNHKNQMHSASRFLTFPITSLPDELRIPEEVRDYDTIYW